MPLSARLAAIVEALPLRGDSRVLEIGCGTGAAARAVAARLTTGAILGIDRSAAAVAAASVDMPARMNVRLVAAEEFVLLGGEEPFDLVFAVCVGALDGRYPAVGRRVMARLAAATAPGARLFVDGREVGL